MFDTGDISCDTSLENIILPASMILIWIRINLNLTRNNEMQIEHVFVNINESIVSIYITTTIITRF